jgi:hypothetical protein
MCLLITIQLSSNLQHRPTYLSYYNLAVGGLRGADALGLEMNYWGDAVTRSLLTQALAKVGEFTDLEIRPSLHQFQNDELIRQSPVARKGRLPVKSAAGSRSLLRFAFRRRADLDDEEFLKYSNGMPKSSSEPLAAFEIRK